MGHNYHILSTALLPQRLGQQLEQAGICCDQIPFIRTEADAGVPVRAFIEKVSGEKRVVVFTSARAVSAVVSLLQGRIPDWQVFCIGGATKEAVKLYFGTAATNMAVADDALALAELIILSKPVSAPVFFCGNISLDILPQRLLENSVSIDRCIVYHTTLTPQKIAQHYDAVLFFSPSGVESFLLANELHPQAIVFSIGRTTAKAVQERAPNKIVLSSTPGRQQLINTVIQYYKA